MLLNQSDVKITHIEQQPLKITNACELICLKATTMSGLERKVIVINLL